MSCFFYTNFLLIILSLSVAIYYTKKCNSRFHSFLHLTILCIQFLMRSKNYKKIAETRMKSECEVVRIKIRNYFALNFQYITYFSYYVRDVMLLFKRTFQKTFKLTYNNRFSQFYYKFLNVFLNV